MFEVFDTFLFDGDGVLYKESSPLPGAIEFLKLLEEKNRQIFILTNNSTRTREEFQDKLKSLGITLPLNHILTSAHLTAQYVKKEYPNSIVYVIGEQGLKQELSSAGLTVVNNWEENNDEDIFNLDFNKIDIVVTGMDRKFNYTKIARAVHILINYKDVHFIATNGDFTFPTVKGLIPGGGAMIAILEVLTEKKVENIIGKPAELMYETAVEIAKSKKESTIMFGDRIETDIFGANRSGITSCLVLSGVTTMNDLGKLEEEHGPDIIINDLRDAIEDFN
jgi:phosphoglycolate/pyridoxal phosphate phosphatase family enzyme